MSILQRYILKKFFFTFLGTIIFLVGIFILVRTMEMLNTFLAASKNIPLSVYFWYYVTEIPYTFNYLFPIGTLFTIVFTLGRMNSDGELTTIYTSGKTLMHYLYPIAIVLFIACSVMMVYDYEILFKPHQKHMDIHRSFRGKTFLDLVERDRENFIQFGEDKKIYIVKSYDPKTKTLEKAKVLQFAENNAVTNIKTFKAATRNDSNDAWLAEDVAERVFTASKKGANKQGVDSTYAKTAEKEIELEKSADLFVRIPHDPVHLSRKQIKAETEKLMITGGNIKKWLTEYHVKIAAPYVAFIMFFLGIPLSTFSRNSVLVLSFFWVLVIAFLYMVVLNLGIALGHSAYLPPILAGWLGNIVFSIVAFILYRRLHR